MTTLKEIEAQTQKYAAVRAALSVAVQEANDELEAIRRTHMSNLNRKLCIAAMQYNALSALIEAAPQLFVKPRSVIIAGIRVGYQKGKGSITWDSDEQVVKLIRKHCADEFDAMVKTTETPIKAALAQASAADLKRLGVTITDAGDEVLIKPADSHVDKLVAALLKNTIEGGA